LLVARCGWGQVPALTQFLDLRTVDAAITTTSTLLELFLTDSAFTGAPLSPVALYELVQTVQEEVRRIGQGVTVSLVFDYCSLREAAGP
jgi:predicted ATP-dependent Lon-type protease